MMNFAVYIVKQEKKYLEELIKDIFFNFIIK